MPPLLLISNSGLESYADDADAGAVTAFLRFNHNPGTGKGTINLGGADGGNGGLYIDNVLTPSSDTHAANKRYVDDRVNGLAVRGPVKAATPYAGSTLDEHQVSDTDTHHIGVHNVALADLYAGSLYLTSTGIDDVTDWQVGDRVLLLDQVNCVENGIWVVGATAGDLSRPADFLEGSGAAGAYAFVDRGQHNADRSFVCVNDMGSDVVGTNDLHWHQYSRRPAALAGSGLKVSGDAANALDVKTDTFIIGGTDGTIGSGGTLEVVDDQVRIRGGTLNAVLGDKMNRLTEDNTFTSVTGSTSTATGAVTVTGGVGIGENLYVGGLAQVLSGNSSTHADGAAMSVVGGMDVGADMHIRSTNTAGSTEPALLVDGGARVAADMQIDGHIVTPYAEVNAPWATTTINGETVPQQYDTLLDAQYQRAVNREYVRNTFRGFEWKQSALLASTANFGLTGPVSNPSTLTIPSISATSINVTVTPWQPVADTVALGNAIYANSTTHDFIRDRYSASDLFDGVGSRSILWANNDQPFSGGTYAQITTATTTVENLILTVADSHRPKDMVTSWASEDGQFLAEKMSPTAIGSSYNGYPTAYRPGPTFDSITNELYFGGAGLGNDPESGMIVSAGHLGIYASSMFVPASQPHGSGWGYTFHFDMTVEDIDPGPDGWYENPNDRYSHTILQRGAGDAAGAWMGHGAWALGDFSLQIKNERILADKGKISLQYNNNGTMRTVTSDTAVSVDSHFVLTLQLPPGVGQSPVVYIDGVAVATGEANTSDMTTAPTPQLPHHTNHGYSLVMGIAPSSFGVLYGGQQGGARDWWIGRLRNLVVESAAAPVASAYSQLTALNAGGSASGHDGVDHAGFRRMVLLHGPSTTVSQLPYARLNYDLGADGSYLDGFNFAPAIGGSTVVHMLTVFGSNDASVMDDYSASITPTGAVAVTPAGDAPLRNVAVSGATKLWQINNLCNANGGTDLQGGSTITTHMDDPMAWTVLNAGGQSVADINGTAVASFASGCQAYPTTGRLGSTYRYLVFVYGVQHSFEGTLATPSDDYPLELMELSPNMRTGPNSQHLTSGAAVDGVVVATGNRVLLKDQLDPTENGLYTITADSPVRTTDMNTGFATHGSVTVVTRGQLNADRAFVVTSDPSSDVAGQDPLLFSTLGQSPAQLAGAGNSGLRVVESNTGTSLAVAVDMVTVELNDSNEVQIRGGAQNAILGDTMNIYKNINTFENTTASTSTTTGAVVVSGGVGIGGDVHVANVVTIDAGEAATSQTSGSLRVDGGIGATGQVHCQGVLNYSDRRLKTNIESLGPTALDKVNKLNGCTFDWLATGAADVGVIAQDVQRVAPHCVNDQSEFLSVNYSKLVPYLIEGIKELTTQVTNLQSEVHSLKRSCDDDAPPRAKRSRHDTSMRRQT